MARPLLIFLAAAALLNGCGYQRIGAPFPSPKPSHSHTPIKGHSPA